MGCDWTLNSHHIEDQCGVCNGDGTGCKVVNGTIEFVDDGKRLFIHFTLKQKFDKGENENSRKSRCKFPFFAHKKENFFNSSINHQPVGARILFYKGSQQIVYTKHLNNKWRREVCSLTMIALYDFIFIVREKKKLAELVLPLLWLSFIAWRDNLILLSIFSPVFSWRTLFSENQLLLSCSQNIWAIFGSKINKKIFVDFWHKKNLEMNTAGSLTALYRIYWIS